MIDRVYGQETEEPDWDVVFDPPANICSDLCDKAIENGLSLNQKYTVVRCESGGSWSFYTLKEFSGKEFAASLFRRIDPC